MFATFEPSAVAQTSEQSHPLSVLVDAILYEDAHTIPRRELLINSVMAEVPLDHQPGIAVAIYQPGHQRILVVRQRRGFAENLIDALQALRGHKRMSQFDPADGARLQIDFFGVVRRDVPLGTLTFGRVDPNRFEFGVDGLQVHTDTGVKFFLPGDSYTRSIQGPGQLSRYLARLTEVENLGECAVDFIRSTSVISFGDTWLRLYRGHPVPVSLGLQDIETICNRAIDHVVSYFRPDGRFLYYYNPVRDNEIDHEHPKRDPDRNPYYNELRHSGGIVTLLLACAYRDADDLAPLVKAALDFTVENSITYSTADGQAARYDYYNRKAKLGGSGMALYSIALYQKVYGTTEYAEVAHEFARHLVNEIFGNGEFRYYHIYLDKPIAEEENGDYFSFYYPGEALVGLATYLKWVNVDERWRAEIIEKMKQSMRYLLVDRPSERAEHYTVVPSDSWLMGAVNEMWDLPELQDPSYADFVFKDADKMIEQMYNEDDALYPDYVGSFYYEYGDLPYPDGARCEGLVAALGLAMKLGDEGRTRRYASASIKAIWATSLLANSPESLYFVPNAEKAMGGVRFKQTRQWFRIDTIQHVVCFYYRFMELYRSLLADGVALDDQFSDAGVLE